MGLEKFFDRVNHDHSDVSGSQANQRQGIAVVDSVLSTSGNPWTGNHSEPRRKQIYDFSLSYQSPASLSAVELEYAP